MHVKGHKKCACVLKMAFHVDMRAHRVVLS